MISAKRLGLAGGILWGAWMFIFTWIHLFFGYGRLFRAFMEDVYPWYHISFWGSIIGLVYGFIDGFVGLFLLAWLYNLFSKRSEG